MHIMKNTKLKIFSSLIFISYIIAALYFMLFSEAMGRTIHSDNYRYNLVLFKEINRYLTNIDNLGLSAVLLNLAGNVICFIPFGIILPFTSDKFKKFYKVMLMMFAFSLFVELLQLVFRIGAFDVDDIFLNLWGALIGYIIYYCIERKIRGGKKNKARSKNKVYK